MTTLYRLWNDQHALLYVGITDNVDARMEEHRADKPWFDEVAQVSTEELNSRRQALEAEARAIYWEQPRYNVLGSTRYSADWEAMYHALEDEEARRCALPDITEEEFHQVSAAFVALSKTEFIEEARLLFDAMDKLYARSRPLSAMAAAGVKRP